MFIQFSDQAWSVYSDDAEKDGVISQYVNYIIEKIRNGDDWISSTGVKSRQVGDLSINYEIIEDRIIIKSIV
ncbi:hypothetical protein [Butyrivibrio sp. MB2005]|uniref:hypothetical protein n=1 Tax=Butyrivibrio sp. MB2005 TaxID=1280678 RepID=UPI000404FF42|nr:hypothetical protein [Butyrivibrio sp. MB2005]